MFPRGPRLWSEQRRRLPDGGIEVGAPHRKVRQSNWRAKEPSLDPDAYRSCPLITQRRDPDVGALGAAVSHSLRDWPDDCFESPAESDRDDGIDEYTCGVVAVTVNRMVDGSGRVDGEPRRTRLLSQGEGWRDERGRQEQERRSPRFAAWTSHGSACHACCWTRTAPGASTGEVCANGKIASNASTASGSKSVPEWRWISVTAVSVSRPGR